jgi:hypothetical protein
MKQGSFNTSQTAPTKSITNGLLFGIPLAGILASLQLGHQIDWSWWLVTAPLWVPFANLLTLGVIGVVSVIVQSIFKAGS